MCFFNSDLVKYIGPPTVGQAISEEKQIRLQSSDFAPLLACWLDSSARLV
ncbi:hypothetical protein ACP4OV_029705 [Aristida adscensionis]